MLGLQTKIISALTTSQLGNCLLVYTCMAASEDPWLHTAGNEGYVIGVVQSKISHVVHDDDAVYIKCPMETRHDTDYTDVPQTLSSEVLYHSALWVWHGLSARNSLTCLSRHFWSASITQRAWRRSLYHSSKNCIPFPASFLLASLQVYATTLQDMLLRELCRPQHLSRHGAIMSR